MLYTVLMWLVLISRSSQYTFNILPQTSAVMLTVFDYALQILKVMRSRDMDMSKTMYFIWDFDIFGFDCMLFNVFLLYSYSFK